MLSSWQSLIPSNEEDRLLAVSRYQIVGTAPEILFDSLAALTAKFFGTPIALVSLVETDSVWFKANFGLPDATHVRREQSLCSVAVLEDSGVVFEDLRAHPCALVDPELLRQLNVGFYASQPLQTSDGFNIGALCVIDYLARSFSDDEQQLLQHLSTTVMLLLELRRLGIVVAGSAPYPSIPSLLHSLTLLAEIGSTGAAIDFDGNPVGTTAIHYEAVQLTALINNRIRAALAG